MASFHSFFFILSLLQELVAVPLQKYLISSFPICLLKLLHATNIMTSIFFLLNFCRMQEPKELLMHYFFLCVACKTESKHHVLFQKYYFHCKFIWATLAAVDLGLGLDKGHVLLVIKSHCLQFAIVRSQKYYTQVWAWSSKLHFNHKISLHAPNIIIINPVISCSFQSRAHVLSTL